MWLYPQHEALKDLIAVRLAAGQDLRFGVTAERVEGAETDRPRVIATDAEGKPLEIEAEFVVGADGSRSVARAAVTGSQTGGYFREYPFAWFGILCEAPPSAPELIYSNSPNGFALISQRSATVQRMYLQCDPELDPNSMSERQIWDALQASVDGHDLIEGPIFQRDVLRFRSFVAHELLHGRVALIGDAAHTVPPTGAKGMNLAVADVVLLDKALRALPPRGRLAPARGLPRDGAAPHLEGAALLVVDDEHAARRSGCHGLRQAPPARRAALGRRVGGGPPLPRRGVHGLAARGSLTRPRGPTHVAASEWHPPLRQPSSSAKTSLAIR